MLRPICLSSIAAAILLSACSGTPPLPVSDSAPYRGPPVSIEKSAAQQRAVVTAPTGGWGVRLDRTIRRFDHTDVYITITRPNPAFMSTQALVRHEVSTEVDPGTPISVFARVLGHDATPGTQTYQVAAP